MVVLSVVAATIFWLFNALNKEYNTTVNYPISWQFDNQTYMVVEELPDKIRINVTGLGWNLLRASLGLKVKPVTVLLTNPLTSRKISGVSLTNKISDQLDELRLNYILNDTLHLYIDRRATRNFAVYVDSAHISLEPGYRIVSPIRCSVDVVEVEGPESMLMAIPSDTFLLKVPQEEISSNYDEELEFILPRPELYVFTPPAARVQFEVAEFVEDKRQINIVAQGFPDKNAPLLKDSTCTVEYLVRRDRQEEVVADSFRVVADYALFNPLDSTILLQIQKTHPLAIEARLTHPQVKLLFYE